QRRILNNGKQIPLLKNLIMHYLLIIILFLVTSCTMQKTFSGIGNIERIDSSVNDILSTGAKAEIIAEGFDWSEGPLWIEKHKMLLFSDVPRNTVYKWTEKKGTQIYLSPSGYTDSVIDRKSTRL